MKILIASDTYYPNLNGAAYFTYRLATLLAKRGHDVSVIAPSPTLRSKIYMQNGVRVYGVKSLSMPMYPNFRFSPFFLANSIIRKFVKKIDPDVIHIQNHFIIGKAVLKSAKEFNIPIMGTNHFMPENLVHYFHLPKPAEEKMKRFGWNQFLKVYGQIEIVTSPTKTAAELVKKFGLKKDVIPLSCGIDTKRFNPRNKGSLFRKKYKIPESRKILLYTGRLDKEKRIEVILKALPAIMKKIDVHFVIAGIGKLKSFLEETAEKLGISDHVTFAGFISEKYFPEIYGLADLFVIAGIAELQSIVTMEAMASGLPVVAVDAMALPELVHDGQNGYLFPEDNSRILADRVIKILSDSKLRKKMSRKSLEIIKVHDINMIVKRYEELYRKTIKLAGRKKSIKPKK